MPEFLTDPEFSAAEGVDEWRALFWGAKALYETGDFATGARFVAAIAELVDATGHAPLVDLRPDTVTVQVLTPGVNTWTVTVSGLRSTSGAWLVASTSSAIAATNRAPVAKSPVS